MIDAQKLGLFTWYSFSAQNPQRIANFYAELFDLSIQDLEIPGMGKTLLLAKDGKPFADISKVPASTPSLWVMYVSVENLDEFTVKAKKLGAQIEGKPFEISGVGTGAFMRDPSGIKLIAFTPFDWSRSGSVMGYQEGLVCFNEIIADDPKKVIPFYSECFGWKFNAPVPGADPEYHTFITPDGKQVGGFLKKPASAPEMPSTWLCYFFTPDLDQSVQKATSLGATLLMPRTEIPGIGHFAMMKDLEQGLFYLFEPMM